jgi:outer membrane immunogenic protein
MRQLAIAVITVASTVACTHIAAAAGLPVKAPVAPPVIAAPSWAGWYGGLNAGYVDPLSSLTTNAAIISTSSSPENATALASGVTSDFGRGSGGFIGGGQIGYNFQWTPAVLVGLETDIQGSSLRESGTVNTSTFVPSPPLGGGTWLSTINATRHLDYLGTLRGRIGLTNIPGWLFYATGGLAYGGVSSSTSIVTTGGTNLPPSALAGSLSQTRAGYAVGGGVEYMWVRGWSAKFEYLYYDLGSVNYSNGTFAFEMGPTDFPGSGIASVASTSSTRFNGQIFRVGVNYHL